MIIGELLQLTIQEKTLGTLTTNALDIKKLVEDALQGVDADSYMDVEIAKKDKATLNKAAKQLNDKRIDLEREFMLPFTQVKDIISDTVKLIKEASDKIDIVVKQSSDLEKSTRRKVIDDLWLLKTFDLVPLERVFKAQWLNKSTTVNSINSDMYEIIEEVKSDIGQIEAMSAFGFSDQELDFAKNDYKNGVKLTVIMQNLAQIKQSRERKSSPLTNPSPSPASESSSVATDELTRSFKVVGTRDQIIALGDYMVKKGLQFEKICISE